MKQYHRNLQYIKGTLHYFKWLYEKLVSIVISFSTITYIYNYQCDVFFLSCFCVLPLFVFFIFFWTCDIDSEFCEWRHSSPISLQAASKSFKMIHAKVNDYFRIIKILILFPQRNWRPLSLDIFFQKFIMSTFSTFYFYF